MTGHTTAEKGWAAQLRRAVYPIFFASGACALIYEVTWTRQLSLVFGISVYAIAAVLGAFMAGLALGSWLLGRAADRVRRPVALYGLLEAGIGLYALLFPWLVEWITQPLFLAAARLFEPASPSLQGARLAVALASLLLPTTLMGGTFPVMSRFFVRSPERAGRDLALLYAVNTVGAVAGTLLAGFVFLGAFGIRGTLLGTALVNLTLAAAAILLGRRTGAHVLGEDGLPGVGARGILPSLAGPSTGSAGQSIGQAGAGGSGEQVAGAVIAPGGGQRSRAAAAATPMRASSLAGDHEVPLGVSPSGADLPSLAVLRLCLVAIFLSGFASLACEVLWTRVLLFYLHNSTYAFSAMLATYLAGITAGSWLMGRALDRIRRRVFWFGLLEVTFALAVVLSVHAVRHLPELVSIGLRLFGLGSWSVAALFIFAQAALVLLLPTLILGAIFPLAARIRTSGLERLGREVGEVYSANTLGAILGSLAAGFLMIPLLGVRGSFVALVCLNLLLGAALLLAGLGGDGGRLGRLAAEGPIAAAGVRAPAGGSKGRESGLDGDRRSSRGWLRPAILGGTAAACLWLVFPPRLLPLAPVPAQVFYRNYERRFGEVLFYQEEASDTVMVVQATGKPATRMLIFSDGRGTAGTPTKMEDRFYGHLPMLLHPDPREVLVICFGVGQTIGAIGRHPAAERIDCAELSPGVVAASRFFPGNHGILGDPRVHLTIEDGRNFLLTSDRKYDVIHLDPPEIHTAGVVNLYTREFYELCRAHLKPGGILSHWVNVYLLPEPETKMLVRTVQEVFPHTTIWQGPRHYSFNFICSDRPVGVDLPRFTERLAIPAVHDDLTEVHLDDPYDFLSLFLLGEEGVQRFAGGAPPVTDDRSRVDFSVPRSVYSGFGFKHPFSAHTDVLTERLSEHDPAVRGGRLNILLLSLGRESVAPLVQWGGMDGGEAEGGGESEFTRTLEERIEKRRQVYRTLIEHDPDRGVLQAWGVEGY